jgi:site-specific recombinase XerD
MPTSSKFISQRSGRTAITVNLKGSYKAFNLRLRAACRALGVGQITAHGLRHSAATILLNHVGKDLREIQELLRHKNIRTTVRYTHVGYEQTRQTAEALSQILE